MTVDHTPVRLTWRDFGPDEISLFRVADGDGPRRRRLAGSGGAVVRGQPPGGAIAGAGPREARLADLDRTRDGVPRRLHRSVVPDGRYGDFGVAHVYVNHAAAAGTLEEAERLLSEFRVGGESSWDRVVLRGQAGALALDAPESGDLILLAKPGFHLSMRMVPGRTSGLRRNTEGTATAPLSRSSTPPFWPRGRASRRGGSRKWGRRRSRRGLPPLWESSLPARRSA